ncbi:hypothetical protein ACM66B_004679 [Microbotryomycetes sp. NB124-2]
MLRRSDSSTSQWQIHLQPDSDVVEIKDQRRLRHVTSISVRNLTLNPKRDNNISALLQARQQQPRPTQTASQSRGSSSFHSSTINGPLDNSSTSHGTVDDADLNVLRAQRRTRTRANSSASAWSIKAHRLSLAEEKDDDDDDRQAHGPTADSKLGRDRSTSRVSVATAGSGSTIRAPAADLTASTSSLLESSPVIQGRPRRDTWQSGNSSNATNNDRQTYFSDSQLSRDKKRTRDVLKKRLVDSAITIELPELDEAHSASKLESILSARKRGLSTIGATPPRHALPRSESSSVVTLKSTPHVRPSRSRTLSTPAHLHPQRLPPRSDSTSTSSTASDPFFVSDVCHECLNPRFDLESSNFTVDEPDADSFDDSFIESWDGMRQSRIVVKVWTRTSCIGREADQRDLKVDGAEQDWKLLTEWDVALDGLVSLGRDPLALPELPPNTLVFTFGDEYLTAASSLRRKRHRRARSGVMTTSSSSTSNSHRRTFASSYTLSDHSSESSDSSDSAPDNGNLSDPGTGSRGALIGSSRRKRRIERKRLDQVEEDERRRKALVERSLRETRMVKAASAQSVHRLIMLENTGREMKTTNADARKRIDRALSEEDNFNLLERESSELQDRLEDLRDVMDDLRADLNEDKNAFEARRQALEARRARLAAVGEALRRKRGQLKDEDVQLASSELMCLDTRSAAQDRRVQIITLLSQMFPIDPVDLPPPNLSSASTHLLFSINNLPLPNSTYPASFPDEILSSALGYTAQVVSLLSVYLSVPLNYPIKCLGSRSAVVDPISMMKGPRAFPLYGKNVDKYRFDYGVFLLNKDIEQLMYSQKLTVIDLRNTLPNLKTLVLSLSLDPSHASFSSSSLVKPPTFFADFNDGTDLSSFVDQGNIPTMLHVASSPRAASPAPSDDASMDRSSSPVSTVRASSIRSASPASIAFPGTNGETDSKPTSPRSSRSSSVSHKENGSAHINSEDDRSNTIKVRKRREGVENVVEVKDKDKARTSSGSSRFSLWSAVGYGSSAAAEGTR